MTTIATVAINAIVSMEVREFNRSCEGERRAVTRTLKVMDDGQTKGKHRRPITLIHHHDHHQHQHHHDHDHHHHHQHHLYQHQHYQDGYYTETQRAIAIVSPSVVQRKYFWLRNDCYHQQHRLLQSRQQQLQQQEQQQLQQLQENDSQNHHHHHQPQANVNVHFSRSLNRATRENNTKVRATLPLSCWPLMQLLWLLCGIFLSQWPRIGVWGASAECPSVCECKWKSGKESVLCLNANLTHIPAPLDAGTQVLDLTGNEILLMPDDTFAEINLLNLQKVYLAKCRLTVIERYAFRGLINLVELDLSHNALTRIPIEALASVTELRELRLSNNPIRLLTNEAFASMQHLVRLELSDCSITAVEGRAFAGLENSLEYLKLDGNRLREVSSGTITSLLNLHGISLARNLWNCSCDLRPLRAWLLKENIPCGIPPLCESPERLNGKSWDKLDLDDFACVPQIAATDSTAHGIEGRNVTMSCHVVGVPEPSIRWLLKNRLIANLTAPNNEAPTVSARTAAATQGRKTYVMNVLRNASNLTILTADMQDAGIYTCAAENKAGKVEASVILAVSRRPPEASLGLKVIILCIFTALLFVAGSSFAAVCFCSLRRKRKTRLWNTVPVPVRTDSYEKIEMTARVNHHKTGLNYDGSVLNTPPVKPDLGGGGNAPSLLLPGAGHGRHCEENGYLCTTSTTTSNAAASGSYDEVSAKQKNPALLKGNQCTNLNLKRNGDYLNVPTDCDDEEDDDIAYVHSDLTLSTASGVKSTAIKTATDEVLEVDGNCTTTNKNGQMVTAMGSLPAGNCLVTNGGPSIWPTDSYRHLNAANNNLTATTPTGGRSSKLVADEHETTRAANKDLRLSRLIDIGTKLDTNPHRGKDYHGERGGGGNWRTTTPNTLTTATTEMTAMTAMTAADKDSLSDNDFFDGNYPDLLDIAKYAVAEATANTKQSGIGSGLAAGGGGCSGGGGSSGLCTLPRKLRTTEKYYTNSSDSQSPLLADNSSKYGSSSLGDASYLQELWLRDRRYSTESTCFNYTAGSLKYSSGQRSNSVLNLVHSCSKPSSSGGVGLTTGADSISACLVSTRIPPSLPSSPDHHCTHTNQLSTTNNKPLHSSPPTNLHHQRSLSSAATPLLDFSTLTTKTAGNPLAMANVGHPGGGGGGGPGTGAGEADGAALTTTTSTTPVAAYDYHAAQLERFLEEYRSLQDQLCKMKETCDTIRKKDTPLRVNVGQAAHAADPVMYSAALATNTTSPTSNAKITLKSKTPLPGQPPDPPPYWLHRNAMLKRLNDSPNEFFKS